MTGEYIVYDAKDNDTLICSGTAQEVADFVGRTEKAIKRKARTPFDEQTGKYKIVFVSDEDECEDCQEDDKDAIIQSLEYELEQKEDEIRTLKESNQTLLEAIVKAQSAPIKYDLTGIKELIFQMPLYEVCQIAHWLNGNIMDIDRI